MTDNNIDIKHSSQKPHIPGTSGPGWVPSSTKCENFNHCYVTTHYLYGLLSPSLASKFESHNKIEDLQVCNIIVFLNL